MMANFNFLCSSKKLDAMIHNIGYPDLVEDQDQLMEEIQGVGRILCIQRVGRTFCIQGVGRVLCIQGVGRILCLRG